MDKDDYNLIKAFIKHFAQERSFPLKEIIEMIFNVVMRIEREQFLGAEHYERKGEKRRGYANGCKPKRLATRMGMIDLEVPKISEHGDTPFYPTSIERGQRSIQALLSAAAECYFQGVSTRDVEKIFKHFGIERLSSAQVSKANKMLDEQFEAWRNRELGEFSFRK